MEEVAEGFDVAFGFVGVFAPGVDAVVVDVDAGHARVEVGAGDVVLDGFGECGDVVVVGDDGDLDFGVGLPDAQAFDHFEIFEGGGALSAVAVAAERGVELMDVINRAGLREMFVDDGVDEGFCGGAVRGGANGLGVEVAEKEVSGVELAFVFSAGGDEELVVVRGADAQVAAGSEQPAVVVEGACGLKHGLGGVQILGKCRGLIGCHGRISRKAFGNSGGEK